MGLNGALWDCWHYEICADPVSISLTWVNPQAKILEAELAASQQRVNDLELQLDHSQNRVTDLRDKLEEASRYDPKFD